MEVPDSAKKKYLEQSSITSPSFLLSAMNITLQGDINYKSSKNQRLLVELTLAKLAHVEDAINLAKALDEGGDKKKS